MILAVILAVILAAILAVSFLLLMTLLHTSGIYMFIFEHNEWKMWRFFWRNISNFKYVGCSVNAHRFTFEDYDAYVWLNGCASIHHETEGCVCGSFWYTKSKRFGAELMRLID